MDSQEPRTWAVLLQLLGTAAMSGNLSKVNMTSSSKYPPLNNAVVVPAELSSTTIDFKHEWKSLGVTLVKAEHFLVTTA